MKSLKIILALALMLGCGYMNVDAQSKAKKSTTKKEKTVEPKKEETPQEEKKTVDLRADAEDALYASLRTMGYQPTIDKNQNSINFVKDKKDYFVRVSGENNPLLYTLYVKSFNFNEKNGLSAEERQQIALKVANEVCRDSRIQMFMDGSLLHIKAPVYASSVDEYIKVLPKYLVEIREVRDKYVTEFNKAQAEYIADKEKAAQDSTQVTQVIVNGNGEQTITVTTVPKADQDTTIMVIQQPYDGEPAAKNVTLLQFDSFARRSVKSDGEPIVDYDKTLKKSNCTYLQIKVKVTATTNDEHTVAAKIFNPKGKLMLPAADATYTTKTTVNLKKNKKPQEVELKKFGYDQPDQWERGEYKVEIYDNGTLIATEEFEII